jgi:uncharacterized protein
MRRVVAREASPASLPRCGALPGVTVPNSAPLVQLHQDIDARVNAIRTDHANWLCGKGCAACCRRLAHAPQLTAAEWQLLREGLAALPAQRLETISLGMTALATPQPGHVICPLLDQATNACLVYAHRPVACRSYGFYVQRDLGLYCSDIEALVAGGALADVLWGNHDAVDRQLAALGERRPVHEWFGDPTVGLACL